LAHDLTASQAVSFESKSVEVVARPRTVEGLLAMRSVRAVPAK